MAFKRILVPLDCSELAEISIAHAVVMARACDSEIYLLHVLSSGPHVDKSNLDIVDWRLRHAEAESYLYTIAARLQADGLTVTPHLQEGRPAEEIVEFAAAWRIDLIILSAYGRGGVSRFQFGSTVQKTITGSDTSILLVRPGVGPGMPDTAAYKRVLVPLDGSHRAEWAAHQAAAMVCGEGAELILLQVVCLPEVVRRTPMGIEDRALRDKVVASNRRAAEEYLGTLGDALRDRATVRTRLVVGANVPWQILQVADEEHADLIAMSAHGGSEDSSWLLGAACEVVMQHARKPLLIFQDLPARAALPMPNYERAATVTVPLSSA